MAFDMLFDKFYPRAYYAAYKLGLEPVIHFQVKSDITARDLLYEFDTVRYFHDAHLPDTTARKSGVQATSKKPNSKKAIMSNRVHCGKRLILPKKPVVPLLC